MLMAEAVPAAGGERAAPVEELGNRSVSSVTERAVSGGSREQDDPRHDKRPAGDNPKGYLLDTTGRYELGAKKGERNSYGDHPQEHPRKEKGRSQGSLADSFSLSPRGHPRFSR